jgi:Methylamine utilisation protein MauE
MDPFLELMIAWSFAALFAASTLHKLKALSEWPGVVRNYRLLPAAFTEAVAGVLLLAGTLTAAALLWAPARRLGACLAAVLLIVFGAAMWINVGRRRASIDCGCFGSRLRHGLSMWMVARNGVMALVVLTLLLPVSRRELSAIEIAAVVCLVATLAFLYPVVAIVLQRPPPTYDENYLTSVGAKGSR